MLFHKDRKYDLICFGRIGLDLVPAQFNRKMEGVESYTMSIGGCPANVAIGAAKLGLKVGFIGKVSDDAAGRFLINNMAKYGVDTSNISVEPNTANSLAIIEVLDPEDCPIVFYRENAADLSVKCSDISEDYIANAKILMISGAALARSPSREAVFLAVDYARSHAAVIVTDIDYRSRFWNSKEEACTYYRLICERSDIILGTDEEFNMVEYFSRSGPKDATSMARRWLDRQAEIVVIKHGKDGSTAYTKGGAVYRGMAYPVYARKTYGAGDAFASSFLEGLLRGEPLDVAVQNGSISAAIVVSKTDCSAAMPTKQEINEFARLHKPGRMPEAF